MRILVTGGAGFIGSHLVDRFLELGHEVAVLDDLSTGFREFVPPRARLYEVDLTDAPAVERVVADFRPEIVDHHAAQIDVRRSVDDPVFDARTNILGALGLLQACTRHQVRKVVYASTGGALYGEGRTLPATEEHPVNPESPYGVSKHTLEHYLYLWKLLHGLDYTVLRYPNVYGPRQNPHGEAGVIAIFAEKLLRGEQPVINGSGEQTRDYVYVGDVARANLLALKSDFCGALNVGTGVETDVNQLFAVLCAATGVHKPEQHGPAKPGEQSRSVLDPSKARSALGWQPAVSLAEGMARTVAYFRERMAMPDGNHRDDRG